MKVMFNLFSFVGLLICLLATLQKRDQWISSKFRDKLDMPKGTIWNIWGMLRSTPWIIFIIFPCLFAILQKMDERNFRKF